MQEQITLSVLCLCTFLKKKNGIEGVISTASDNGLTETLFIFPVCKYFLPFPFMRYCSISFCSLCFFLLQYHFCFHTTFLLLNKDSYHI